MSSRKDRPRIAIVGAGLGGTVAAILLQQAGQDVCVFEQAPGLARIGTGIGLGPNTLRIMNHIGAWERIRDIGIAPETSLSREWDTGRVLFNRAEGLRMWEKNFGFPMMLIHRGDLLSILGSKLAPNTIQFRKRLVNIGTRMGGTQLIFDDGLETEADIVIGADGINSNIRELLLGPEQPTYTGFVAYRSLYPASRLGEFRISSDQAKWWSDERHPAKEDRHFIIYYLTRKRDEIYFVTGSPDPNWPGGTSSIPADVAEIKKCYDGFHPEVQRVIDACPQASKWPLMERDPLPLWSQDNIVLLGDACHPMKPHMGMGAAMAFEDAAVLSRCILTADGNYPLAFALYYANRIQRTARVQKESHDNKWMKYPASDPTWVYEYDATKIPLVMPERT